MNQPVPLEQEPDFTERQERCNKELSAILTKYELGLLAVPHFELNPGEHSWEIKTQVIYISTRKPKEEKKAPLAQP